MNHKSRFEFTGGNVCLDFTNTVDNRGTAAPKELLSRYIDLVTWAGEAGLLGLGQVERLYRTAGEIPGEAQNALRFALQLREAIYAIFSALADHRAVPGNAMSMLNVALRTAAEHLRLMERERRFSWEWLTSGFNLDCVSWMVAKAAADLLTSPDVDRVRRCASSTCAWLFLDKTKNRRRRWCEMKTCGNRAKARSYYHRQRA